MNWLLVMILFVAILIAALSLGAAAKDLDDEHPMRNMR
jgi:uncharacterized membrane protein YciS (DUF1049 family)